MICPSRCTGESFAKPEPHERSGSSLVYSKRRSVGAAPHRCRGMHLLAKVRHLRHSAVLLLDLTESRLHSLAPTGSLLPAVRSTQVAVTKCLAALPRDYLRIVLGDIRRSELRPIRMTAIGKPILRSQRLLRGREPPDSSPKSGHSAQILRFNTSRCGGVREPVVMTQSRRS